MAPCQQCEKWLSLATGGVYSRSLTYYESLEFSLLPDEFEFVSDCPGCSMLSSLLVPFSTEDNNDQDGVVHVHSVKLLPISSGSQTLSADSCQREVQSGFMDYSASKGSNYSENIYITYAIVFWGVPRRIESVHQIKLQSKFDPLLISRWIGGCKCQHAADGAHQKSLPVGMRLIDLENNCLALVEPSTIPRYVALSYMWEAQSQGSPCFQTLLKNIDELSAIDGLLNRPFTGLLKDCMNFCRDLGYRYLWIDRFCIIQDDFNGSKMAQICAMDSIYSCAAVTLISALNDKNATGLPGYHSVERDETSVDRDFIFAFDYGESHFESVLAVKSQDAVKGSLWETRGWTFQELFLSVHRLVVSSRHVFFECPSLIGTELLAWQGVGDLHGLVTPGCFTKNTPKPTEAKAYNELIDFHQDFIEDKFDIHDFIRALKSYTKCNLTFASDSHNAFLGICSEMAPWLGGHYICGIPVKFLFNILLWRRSHGIEENFEVNANIPSWSWAKRFGPVDYTRAPIEPMETCNIWHHTFPPGLTRVVFDGSESLPSSAFDYSPSDLVSQEALRWPNCLVFQGWTIGSNASPDTRITIGPHEDGKLLTEARTSGGTVVYAAMDFPLREVIEDVKLLFLVDPVVVARDHRKAGGILVRQLASKSPGVTVCERIGYMSVSPRGWIQQPLSSMKCIYGEIILT